MKAVLTYELADGAFGLAQQHFPAHQARLQEFQRRGLLLMVGTFSDDPVGAMAVFTARSAAEEFMTGDPFLAHGVVGAFRLRDWDEVLQPVEPGQGDAATAAG